MDRTALVSLGNQVVVIGLDGKLRVLTEGQQPLPGEVVVTSTDVGPLDLNVQLTQEQGSKDVTDDVLQIISAIEQGQDPSAVDEEFAPAAGENGGSSLQTSATIVRDGTELLASTSFETIGIESLGLSQTQVLALNDLFRSNLQTSADSTDKPLATTPVTLDAIEEDGGSIIITTEELLSNVDDEDKDTLSVENLIIDKGNGTLVDNGDGTWTFTPQIDDDTEVSFTFDIIDDEDLVVSGSANLDILPINDAPNAENDVITTEEDTAVTIDVLVNDSDVEGDALSIQSASVPSEQGSVDIVDGKLVFTPAENFNGEATITYIVTDGDLTDEAKVTVTVTPVNDSPVAVDDTTSIQEDTAVTIDVLTNDTDVDGDKLSIESASVPKEQGTVEVVDGKLVFTPVENFNGHAEITYTVTDGQLTDEAKVTVTVNPVNDAPTIKVDAVESITEDAVSTDTVVATLTVRDTDTPEDQLTVSLENNSNGYFVLVGNEVKLTQAGVDAVNNDELNLKDLTISASVSDGVNPTASDSDSLIVNRVNDAPTVENAIADQELSEDFATYTIDLNDAFKDSDSALNFSVSGNSNVLVSIENGIATISPTADWNGSETLTFTATDPSGESISQTVNFTVAPVADIVADTATVVEDTPTIIKVLGNDTFEGDGKVVSLDANNGPVNGSVSVNPDGSVTYTPNDNYHGIDSFTYIVTSGGVSESTTVNVDVTPENDAPVAKDDTAITDEDTPVTIDVLPNDTDVDGDKLSIESASVPKEQGTVEVVNGKLVFTPAENFNGDAEITYTVTDGQLTDEAKVTVTVNPVNDAPTIKVDAVESITEDAVSIDTVVAILTVRDTDTSEDQLTVSLENNSNGYFVLVGDEVKLTQAGVDAVNNDELNLKDLTISASVSDGVNPTANDSDSLIVNRVNDAPTVENAIADQVLSEDFDTYTIDLNEVFKDTDSSLEFSVSGNNSIQISIVNGVATITPTADWNGKETITFTAKDPSGESVSQTVDFTVAPVVDIEADSSNVVEDTPTIINVLGNDTFEGKDKVVSLDAENGPKNGTVIVNNDGTVTYTPDDNYVGKDTFTYVVTSGGVSESTTVEVNVTPVNDAPVAKDDIATTQEDTAVTIDVLPNDTDADGDKLSIESASVPKEQGTVEVVDGKLVFTPAENFNGHAEITYTVTDGALTDQATVKVTVNAVNDTPVVESNIADQALAEDFTPYTIDLNTAFSDVDNVDGELTFSVSGNSNIQVAILNGIATITPTADWNGSETLTFTATDPSGESISQTVNFTVAPVADIVADKATVVEDTPTIIKVLGNDTFEGDGKVVSLDANNGPANGTVSVNPDGSVTYTPNDNYVGEDTFTYVVTSGGASESTTVEVNVTPVNDAPVAKDDIATTQEDTAVTIDVLPNDTDADGDKLSIESASVPKEQGTVEVVDGKLVFTPAENFNGHAEITYTVTDGQLTDEAKVTVTVNPVNDAPTIKVDAVEGITENAVSTDTLVATLEVADTDTPEDQLTVSLENNSNGYFVLVGDEVKLTQAGVDAVNNDELNLKDLTISASVSDGVNPTANDSDSLIVNRVNDAPTVENAIADQELSEDFATYTIDLNDAFKDSDSALNFSVSGNSNVLVSIENGIATITPTADWNGSETLTFTATDPSGESVSQTVNFTVAPVADIVADKATVVEDTPTIIKVLGNDTFEGTDKVVSLDTNNGPANGTVSVNPDGSVTYTPNDNYHGADSFTYIVTSGGVSESTTVSVDVTPENDAPVAKDDTAITDEDTPVTIDVLPNDTDVDGDKLSVESASVPKEQGTVEVVNGKLVFTPAENFNGDAEITYTVTDGELTDEAKVTVTVNPVNDAPTIKVDAVESITEDAVNTDTVVATLTVRDTDTSEDQLTVSLENNSNGYFVLVGDEVKLTQAGVDAVNNDELNLKDLTISASVSDGVNPTANDSDSLIVNRVNDAPTVENAIADQELSEDFATYTIDLNDAFKDSDSALNFSVSGNSNVLVSIENGIATISPTADWNGSETLTFTATDPSGESISQTVNFTVASVADIVADKATVVEDTPTIIKVLGNDTFEGDGKVVSLDADNGPKNGTVIVNNDGTVTYTPNDNYVGKDTFTYIVTSGGVSESTTVNVDVTPVNDVPVAKDDTATTQEDTAVTIDVLPNDTDIDGDTLRIDSASVPSDQGTVEVVDGKLVFTPAENFNGNAEITYTVTDGQLTDEAKVTVTVNPVNDAPTIKVDAVESITEDAVSIDTVVAALTVRDTDTPEDQLTVSLENNSNGYFVLVGNEVKLTQAGVDAVNNDELNLKDLTISASVSDGVNPTANDSDSLVVNRVNDAPTVENAIADQELSEDFATYTIDLNDAFKDSDSALNFSVSGNSNVLVSIENGIATITPTADWNGSETVTFTATDPSGENVSQTVDFTVAPVVDIKADSTNVVEDTPTIINVLGNDTFEGKDKVVSLDAENGPKNGTVIVNNDGTVTYTPNDNYVGKDTFTYIVTSGGVSESTTVEVNVTPVNDAPVAKDDIATTQEDTVVTIDVLSNDTDVDGDKLSIQSASVPEAQGKVEIVDGKLVFTPAENFNGHAEIIYTVTDGELTDEAKVTVTVNPVNDAPTIKVDAVESITEDAVNTDTVVATLTVRDTDTPEDQLTVSLENNSNGYFVLVGNEVKLTQAGVDAVNNDELNLKDLTISASVSDGVNPTASDSDSLVVNRVNDAPTVENAIADQVLSEDFDAYTIDLNEVFKDSDSSLEFSVSGNNSIQISIVNGVATITPTADWNGKETITFTAKDPSGESVNQTVDFTVAPVVDIEADSADVVEDTPTIINVLGNDTFESTDKVVSLDAENGPKNGTVIVNNDGTVTYTPDDNYVGEDTFTYIVTSGGVSESTTVSVDVTPENDAPVAKDDTAITDEDTPVTIDVLPNDTDVDGDKLSVESASVPKEQGTVEVVNGKLVFTPAENFNGDAEITYTVTDGQLTDEAKVTVTVNPVNDAPTIKVDAVESITEDGVNTDTVVATLTVRDTDTPEDQLTVSLENNSNGYFVLVGNEVKLAQVGVDAVNNDELNLKDLTISASVSDGVNPTASDSDSLVVNRVNDAPTVENAIADQVLSEDFDTYTIDLNEVFKDSDSSLEFSVSGNDNIQISIVNGVATITPTADWNGSETLTFTATDPSGESVSQTVDFTVAPVVDIEADSADVVEDTPTIINVLGNDTFEGKDKVVSLDAENGPKNGTVIVNNDGTVTYTPDDNYVGKDTFTYIVTSGGVSESTTVEVNVTPVNDAPVAKDDIATTQEDTAVTIDVLPNDSDVDGDKLSIQSATVPEAQGKVEIVEGKLVFTPAENFNGDAEITYTVTDGSLTDQAKVTVTVNPVDDAPTIKVDAVESITEDAVSTDTVVATLTVRDTDTPEDQLTVSLENNSNGYFVLVGNEVKLTQVGVDAVNNDELNLKDLTISASVSDGVNPTASDSDSLIVTRVNDAPTVENAIADQELAEDFASYTIDLNDAFKDSDSALNFSVSGNSNVSVSIENGIATISPTADWNGSETLTFTATDPNGESVSQTVDFTVAPVVDIEADSTNVVEDTPTIINVLGNDTFEGKDIVVSLDAENGPKNGTVIVNNDGTVTYTPDDNYVGKDTFTYVVTSGGVSESTTVTVNVTPVNDKPESEDFTHVADDQLTQVVFDTDTKPLGSGDSKDHIADVEDDLKGNDLHVRITELPTSGTLFFKDSDGELHEIKEVSDTLYDKDSLYYEADNVGFLLGIKDRPNTPNGSESTSDFNNWGLSEDGGPSHSRIEHLANGASITISSDSGELAQYNRQVSHIGNGIADNDGQGIEKGETITVDLSNNPVGSVNLGLDGLGGLFDYGDDNAALITVTYLDSNNVQQTQTFEFLKPEGNFMLFQETSVGYGKDLALPEGSVITQLDFSTKNEGNWELRYVEGVPAEDSFGYVAVDSESGVSDPSTVNIVNEMLDGNVAENGPAVQSITGVTVVEGDDVTFSVSLNNATDQTVKYQVDFSAEGSSTSSQDIDLSNATFTNGVKYLGGYLIVPAGVNGFEITIPSIDDQLVESTESLVIKVGDVSGVGYIDDNDVPPTVQSNEISGLEDEAIVITLEHLGVVDSGVSVEFDTSALNGSLQVKGSDGWEAVSGSVLASDIENGLVRYVPAEHESGANVFDKDGVGNGLDTYEQIHFTVSDGNSSASGTLSIDIEPVADPIKIDLTFGPVTSVPVTLGGSWSTDEELKDLLEASNLPGLDFEHVVTQAFNNGHAGNDLMLSGDTESPLSFVGDQQAGANVDAQGSDIFVTGGGNDSIYGGIGSLDDQAETDTVVYSGKLSDYDFSYYPASDHSEVPYWIVEDSRFIDTKDVVSSTHKESGDHLYEIEQLIFQDAIIKLDNNTGEYVVLTEQQVSFELNLDLIDVDGSESFINDSVTLTGIPSGLTLEVNGKTVTENSDGSYTVDLSSEPNQTSHQLSGTITVPADYNGSLDFDVTATAGSVEVNNNTQMGADTASVSVRDYEFVSGTHGDNNIVGSDDNDVIVGDVQGLQIVEGQDYNIAFMLDTSGSMGYDVGRAVTELKTVLNTLIESASGPHSGKVNVLLTTFSTESKQVLELDLSSDNAKSQVESILDAIVKVGDGNTNYEAGFQSALNWFENADSGATNLSYFISDGRPNQATDNNVNWYSSKESVVLGVSEQQLVTLADVLPSDYRFGDTVTYNNKTVIDFRGTVYSLSTGEKMGRMLNSYEYDDYGNNVLEQANNAYSALAEFSEVRSIGIGGHLNEDSLKHFDSDGVVRTNIDVNQLAEVILGKEVSLMQGKDEISSLDGNDIIFGDAIRFDINGEQGVSALQNYVASQLGKDVALVTKEEVHHYITENQAEFEQSRYYDQADTIYGGAGNDILFGQGGNDKLFGGADNDILIGGLGSDILTGGDGEDIFKWIDVANERDTVTDFSSSEDSLDFSDLFDDLSKDEVGDLLSDLQSGSHTGDAGGFHIEVSQDGSADTNLSITKGSSTLDIHFNSASVDDITQHLIASLDSQYKDM
ncbi:tandem-95 repeat protein [Vibrio parahaemolyticus]|uniref:tandem-95 repeat protein n=41 Tax=Vibrio parahaemolyticus TaxID=670 RepID=UPI0013021037|nr:tandem-95 repeat protein [Vibrio parahaemolyticus]EGQ8136454.1 tandem-95 repeat protein [Vibrio parahaemolyticus]EGQ8150968.1 tandem-95 repeat protein [Vibrio parahaemolyticus]EGQ8253159.1 tandem-95 repeat protein [Vibrio parahaemolyticus]EGQ8266746.1 tandem-95 repeat protein [Vibrio parahaemolyticus]EGQ8270346.1 tandem-95 repeat protein [Vibrio parahaemolyticus]